MITRAQKALVDGTLFNEFVPVPEQLKEATASTADEYQEQNEKNLKETGFASWYDYCVNEWGTKWDCSPYSNQVTNEGKTLSCAFDTAWAPPVAFYEKMENLGFTVEAMYYEPGMGFCGIYECGFDETYDVGVTAELTRETIPESLDAEFAISENQEMWEDENGEE
jgi:hypothetical protein